MSVQPTGPSPNLRGRTLGSGRDWRRRVVLHHVPLAVVSAALFALFMDLVLASPQPQLDMTGASVFPQEATPMNGRGDGGTAFMSRGFMARSTAATGYVATGLLALTLLIGPANLLFRKRNPVSSYLRRDVGAWTAIVSVVHVVLGLQVHGRGGDVVSFLTYFIADGLPRTNSFGLGNWTGLVATVIAVGLLAISTDRSMRELKSRRWKSFQRLNYGLFALVVLHAFFYGALLQMTSPFALGLIGTVMAVLVIQLVGIWLWRRRHARAAAIHRERQPTDATQ